MPKKERMKMKIAVTYEGGEGHDCKEAHEGCGHHCGE